MFFSAHSCWLGADLMSPRSPAHLHFTWCFILACGVALVRGQAQTPFEQVKGSYIVVPVDNTSSMNPIGGCVAGAEIYAHNLETYVYGATCAASVYLSGSLSLSDSHLRVFTLGNVKGVNLFSYTFADADRLELRNREGVLVSSLIKQPVTPVDGVWRVPSKTGTAAQFGLLRLSGTVFSVLDPLEDYPADSVTIVHSQHGGFHYGAGRTFPTGPSNYSIDFTVLAGLKARAPTTILDGFWAGFEDIGVPLSMQMEAGLLRYTRNRTNIAYLHYVVFPESSVCRIRGHVFPSFNFTYSLESQGTQLVLTQPTFGWTWTLRRVTEPPDLVEVSNLDQTQLSSFTNTLDPSLYTVFYDSNGCATLFLSDDVPSGITASSLLQSAQLASCSGNQSSLSTPAIAGISAGAVLLLLALAVVLPLSVSRCRKQQMYQLKMAHIEANKDEL